MQPLTFPAPVRYYIRGLDATPTGTDPANDVVADFTGGTVVQEGGGILAPDTAVVHTPSQTLGSTFAIRVRGLWHVRACVQMQTAAAVIAALSLDAAAGELNADPVLSDRIRSRGQVTQAAAGDLVAINLDMVVGVRQDAAAAGALVRLLLSNAAGAGAAAASLVLPQCCLELTRIADLS